MKNDHILTIIIVALLLFAVSYIVWQNKITKMSSVIAPEITTPQVQPAKYIEVTTPLNMPLSGDELIAGVARRVYFEGSFPVRIIDTMPTPATIWQGFATAQSDWMTTDIVPYTLTIPTTQVPNGNYILVLTEDDPSGEIPTDKLYTIKLPITISN